MLVEISEMTWIVTASDRVLNSPSVLILRLLSWITMVASLAASVPAVVPVIVNDKVSDVSKLESDKTGRFTVAEV